MADGMITRPLEEYDGLKYEIIRLKSTNAKLVSALTDLIMIKRALGFGGSAWDKAEEVLKETK